MFNVSKIQEKFAGLVGVRLPIDPVYNLLSAGFYESKSGLFVDDVEMFDFKLFVDNLPHPNPESSDVTEAWGNMQNSVIANVVNQVFSRPDYIDRQVMFKNAYESQKFEQILDNTYNYGYEIEVSSLKNVSFVVSRVIIEAVGSGEFTLGLFASGVSTPLFTKVVEFPAHSQPFVVELGWNVNGATVSQFSQYEDVIPYKGKYFIGILKSETNDFTPRSRNYEFGERMSFISELDIDAVKTQGIPSEWENNESTSTHNGLNFDITVLYDYTDLAIQNKQLFAKAIQINWAINVLNMALKSMRSNRNQRVSAELHSQILLAINGNKQPNSQRVYGLRETLLGEIARIQQEVFKIDEGYFGGEIMMDTVC